MASLLDYLEINDLSKDNIIKFIKKIFEKIKFEDYNDDILTMLKDMINLGLDFPLMQINLDQNDLFFFCSIYEKYIQQYNTDTQLKMKELVRFIIVDNKLIDQNSKKEQSSIEKLINDKVLELFNEKLTSLNTQINSSMNISVNNNETHQNKPFYSDDLIRFNLEKMIMAKHHINIMKLHIENNTTPASLFFNRFPLPFYAHDVEYIEKYNQRIKEFQNNVMNDIIHFSEKKIQFYQQSIDSCMDSVVGKPDNFNELILKKLKEVEIKNKDYFDRKMNKARRCIAKPFRVIEKSKHKSCFV